MNTTYPEIDQVPDRTPRGTKRRHSAGCDHVDPGVTWRQVTADELRELEPCRTCVGRLNRR